MHTVCGNVIAMTFPLADGAVETRWAGVAQSGPDSGENLSKPVTSRRVPQHFARLAARTMVSAPRGVEFFIDVQPTGAKPGLRSVKVYVCFSRVT